jgi:MFS family permease
MWIFVSPAVMDTVVFLVMFAVSYGAGERGMNTHQCAWLGGLFQLVYMASSLAAGAVLTRGNAKGLLLGSVVLCLLTSAAALILTGYVPLLIALAGFGMGCAIFFNAFQTFMRGEAPPGGLVRVTALYTCAWSSGASLGFLASGSLFRLGGVVMSLLVLAASAFIFVLLFRHRVRPGDSPSADEHVDAAPGNDPGLHGAYVGVAWVMIFTAMFVQRPLQTFYPALAGRAGVAAALAGAPLFVHMLLQAVAGGLMVKARGWLYRPGILATVQLLGVALLVVVWRFPVYAVVAPGIGLLGLWAGFMYFCSVFYASNAGNRSRNVGINECLVGLGSFAGLFVSEWFMTRLADDDIMYAVCAAALLISVAVQMTIIRIRSRAGR